MTESTQAESDLQLAVAEVCHTARLAERLTGRTLAVLDVHRVTDVVTHQMFVEAPLAGGGVHVNHLRGELVGQNLALFLALLE